MRLVIDKRAQRRLHDMPKATSAAMLARLEKVAADPFAHHGSVKALRGEVNAFRLRQGNWRALYRVDRERQEVRVYVIQTREKTYR